MPDNKVFKIAAIPGDGIGTEITEAAIQVLDKVAAVDGTFKFEWESYDWSSKNYSERGWYMPPDWVDQLKKHDAIYFGAVGWPSKTELYRLQFRSLTLTLPQAYPTTSRSGA